MRLLPPALPRRRQPGRGLDDVVTERRSARVGATVRQAGRSHACATHPAARGRAAARRAHGHAQPRHRLRLDRACRCRSRAPARARRAGGLGDRRVGSGRREIARRGALPRPVHDRARAGRAPRRDGLAASSAGDEDSRSRSSPSAAATTRSAWPPRASAATSSASSSGPSRRRPTVLEVDPEHPGESAAAQVEPWGSIHASPDYLRQLVRVLVDRVVARARERAA